MEEKWCYRGEGNASIVAACVQENIVYRIKKVNGSDKNQTSGRKPAFAEIEFIWNIMSTFISAQFLVPMKTVQVPDQLLEVIKTSCTAERPGYRLCKNIGVGAVEAIQMPDLCFISLPTASSQATPTFSFEIKPKWGLIPVAHDISDVKRSNCRFCMHQFLKIKQGKWPRRSLYCPIDLFSGCPVRMKYALHNLFSCPQNNFCISKNGKKIWSYVSADKDLSFDDQLSLKLKEELLDVVLLCLLYPSASKQTSFHRRRPCHLSKCEHSCSQGCADLPAGCVLSELLDVQGLDDLDIEGLYDHYKTVSEAFSLNPELRSQSHIDGPHEENWLKVPSSESSESPLDFNIAKVKQYLVSRSAKDCSIFVTIQETDSKNLPSESDSRAFLLTSSSGSKYICCVSVIDLDPKSFDKIPAYLEEDKDVINCFKAFQQSLSRTNGSLHLVSGNT